MTLFDVLVTPTILDMMGIGAKPAQMDGRSWLGVAQRKTTAARRKDLMIEYVGGKGGPPLASAAPHEQEGQVQMQIQADLVNEDLGFINSMFVNATRNGKGSCSANADDELSLKVR